MKQWIKKKLKDWLGMSSLEKQFAALLKEYGILYDKNKEYRREIIKFYDSLKVGIDVSADTTTNNWAIIAFRDEANRGQIRVFNLSNDIMLTKEFIKHFHRHQILIDSPPQMEKFFNTIVS